MKPPVPGSIRNLEHRSSWCCHVWTWAKLVLVFFKWYISREWLENHGSFRRSVSNMSTLNKHVGKEGKELHQSHGRPHHYSRFRRHVLVFTGPRAPHIQLVTTCKGPRPFWAGDVVKILLDHVVYFWKQDLGHFEDTSCNSFFTIPSPRIHKNLLCHLLPEFSPTALCCALSDFLTDPVAPHFLRWCCSILSPSRRFMVGLNDFMKNIYGCRGPRFTPGKAVVHKNFQWFNHQQMMLLWTCSGNILGNQPWNDHRSSVSWWFMVSQ